MPQEDDLARSFYVRIDMDFKVLRLELSLLPLLLPGGRCCGESIKEVRGALSPSTVYISVAFDLFNTKHALFFITSSVGDGEHPFKHLSVHKQAYQSINTILYSLYSETFIFYFNKIFPISKHRVHFQELYEIPPS